MKIRESRCNHCAECVQCGRDMHTDIYTVCDGCGAEENIYCYEEKDYCTLCLLERLLQDGIISKE